MRAITYARVSGNDRGNDGRNLAGQLEMCREYAEAHGWRVVAELAEDDRGASGASFELPQLNRALEMARAGECDVMVVRELDRFARGLAKQLIVEGEFKRAGVAVEYVLGEYPDTPEGNLMKNVRAVVAEYERLKINERMTRGRKQKVKAGSVMTHGRAPYGYRLVERDGKQMLEVDESEARVVRMLFTWYTEGDGENGPISIRSCTGKLSELEIPTAADTGTHGFVGKKKAGWGKWCRATVHQILRNETYAGIWHYGKKASGGKTRNARRHWIAVEVPAIVAREVWEAAQERLRQNKQESRRNLKYQYLMGKRLICGDCGSKMVGHPTHARGKLHLYYRCRKRYQDYDTCDFSTFRADQVDTAVWGWVKSFLTDPEAMARGLEAYQAERDEENTPIRERLRVVDDLLTENRAQLERLLDLYLAGDFPKEVLVDRKERLETTIEVLEKERAGLVVKLEAQTLTTSQIRSLQDFAAQVAEGLEMAEKDFQTRRWVIEALGVQATLAIEDGEQVVYARCMLGERVLQVVSNTPM